jgi:hypothetical protein
MEVAMIRFISKVKAGFLILLAVLSILIGSFTLFGKKSYAELPRYGVVVCIGGIRICEFWGSFYCCYDRTQ